MFLSLLKIKQQVSKIITQEIIIQIIYTLKYEI